MYEYKVKFKICYKTKPEEIFFKVLALCERNDFFIVTYVNDYDESMLTIDCLYTLDEHHMEHAHNSIVEAIRKIIGDCKISSSWVSVSKTDANFVSTIKTKQRRRKAK